MRRLKILGAEIALGLLLNLTAALFDKALIVSITRWGWLLVLLHATYIVVSTNRVRKASVRLLSGFGRYAVTSYLLVALVFAGVGIAYWAGINAVYSRLVAAPKAPVEPPPPTQNPVPPPSQTGSATTLGDNSPAITGSGNKVTYEAPSEGAKSKREATK